MRIPRTGVCWVGFVLGFKIHHSAAVVHAVNRHVQNHNRDDQPTTQFAHAPMEYFFHIALFTTGAPAPREYSFRENATVIRQGRCPKSAKIQG